MAAGRHNMAKAAPSSKPLDLVTLDRYKVSNLEMHRSPIIQYCSGVTEQSAILPEVNVTTEITVTDTASTTSHWAARIRLRLPLAKIAIITNGQIR